MNKIIDRKSNVLRICAGNDFTILVQITEYNTETGAWVNYDLSAVSDVHMCLIADNGKRINLPVTVNSNGTASAPIQAAYLQKTTYGVELTWLNEKLNRRTYAPCLLQIVTSTAESTSNIAEYDSNDAYHFNIKMEADVAILSIGKISDEYITESELEKELENYTTNSSLETKLEDYTTNASLETKLNDYATKQYVDNGLANIDLSEYYTKSEVDNTLNSYAKLSSLEDYVTNTSLNTTLQSYVTDSELNTSLNPITSYITSLDDRVTTLESGGSGVSQEDWDNSNEAIAKEFVNNRLEHLSINDKFNDYYTKNETDNRYATQKWSNDKFVAKTDDVNRQEAIAAALSSSVQSTTIHNIVQISQTDYDALTEKDINTLYIIL